MTRIEKCNLKMHFAARRLKSLQPVPVVEIPVTVGLPVVELPVETGVSVFVRDFSVEHSSPGGTISAVVMVAASSNFQVPETPSTPRS